MTTMTILKYFIKITDETLQIYVADVPIESVFFL